jgi:CubicO group peptidase (beta-lactamase class C family)
MTFPDGAVTYDAALNWQAFAAACLQVVPETPPGMRVAYSNVGYGLLAIVVERVTSQAFAEALAERVVRPLGLEAYFGHEPPRPIAAIADPYDTHVGTPLERWNTPFFCALAETWGGLVTTQAEMLTLANTFRGLPAGFLTPEIAQESTRNQTGDLGGGAIG